MKLVEGLGPHYPAAAAVYRSVSTMPDDASIDTCSTYLNGGAECGVFALDAEHVIKIPKSEWSLAHWNHLPLDDWALEDRANLAKRAAALDRAIGAVGLEQLVAYDLTKMPSVITGRLHPVQYADSGATYRFTAQDYHSLFAGLESLQDRKLNIDPSSSNCLYEQGKGFAIIDYHLPDSTPRSLQQDLVELAKDDNFDAYHNHDNARAYHQAIIERYGQTMADPVLAQWHTEGVSLSAPPPHNYR